MTILQAIILGIIQGLTEFLPVSSSAHLVIIPHLLGWQIPPQEAFIFNVLVQTASLIAVIAYFWQELLTILSSVLRGLFQKKPLVDEHARLGWLILLATIPAGLIGLGIKDLVEGAFGDPGIVGFFMLITAGLLVIAERIGSRKREIEALNWKDTLWIGFAQAIAIFPGISRSAATIAGGMSRGLGRAAAAHFSFLMVIPIMVAAGLLAGNDLLHLQNYDQVLTAYIFGMAASAIVSYLSIRWLLKFLIRHSLYIFAAYCLVMGLVVLVFTNRFAGVLSFH
jgi:undecaprenyl-diphosphatase